MRLLFRKENDKKVRIYTYKDISFLKKHLEEILNIIDFTKPERQTRNTCNFFKNNRPNIYWWIATQLADYEWTYHGDGYYTNETDLKAYWNCYSPHLIMGEDLDRLLPLSQYLVRLTHIVSKNPSNELVSFCQDRDIKLWKINYEMEGLKYIFKVEKLCGKN